MEDTRKITVEIELFDNTDVALVESTITQGLDTIGCECIVYTPEEVIVRKDEKPTIPEVISWNTGRPQIEARYLIQDTEGTVDISYYYVNGDIFRHEMEGGAKVIKFATIPTGK